MKLLAAVLAVVVVATSGFAALHHSKGANAQSTAVSWSVSKKPFRLTFTSGGKTLTSETASGNGPAQRLGYLAGGVAHTVTNVVSSKDVSGGTKYTVATDEPGRHADVTVTHGPSGAKVRVDFAPSSGVDAVFESFTAAPQEHFLGAGEGGDFVDLRGHVVSLKVSYHCGNEFPMPYFQSTAGYGVFVPTLRIGRFAFPGATSSDGCTTGPALCPVTPAADRVELCFKAPTLRYDVYAGTPAQIMTAYTGAAGRPAATTPLQFGGEKWRGLWADNNSKTILADAAKYRQLGIPLTWDHINDPWEVSTCWGTDTFDGRRFPDPAGLVRDLRAQGLHVMIWISPLVARLPQCPPSGYSPNQLLGSGRDTTEIDLTELAAKAVFEKKLKRVFALGIQGIKGDRGDDLDLERTTLHAGSGVAYQNAYPVLYARAAAEALHAVWGNKFSTIFRTGSLGTQSVLPGIFLGDEPGTYGGLQVAIRAGLTAGVSGYPVWGSDIGGYANDHADLTPQLFMRWAQFGAVSPVFEVGGIGTSSHFWDFGKPTVDAFRAAAILHYELVPYFVDLSHLASTTGVPIVRPLAFAYPADEGSWHAELEFLVGDGLLAAPVTGGGTTPSVYLPPGKWADLYAGGVVGGPASFTRPTPDNQFPLYLRSGSAIPFNLRANIWKTSWGLSDLIRPGRAGWLYAPGAGTTKVESSTGGTFTANTKGSKVDLQATGAPRELQVLVLTSARPSSVTIDGKTVLEAKPGALPTAATGWLWRPAPFGGVLLKLRTTNGSAAATVDITSP